MAGVGDGLLGHDEEKIQVRGDGGAEHARAEGWIGAQRGRVAVKQRGNRRRADLAMTGGPGEERIAELAARIQRPGVLPVEDDEMIAGRGGDDVVRVEVPVAYDALLARPWHIGARAQPGNAVLCARQPGSTGHAGRRGTVPE